MIKYWREDLQLFLPPDNMITAPWVREIYKENGEELPEREQAEGEDEPDKIVLEGTKLLEQRDSVSIILVGTESEKRDGTDKNELQQQRIEN